MDEKPKVGTIQIKEGKASIYLNNGPEAFDINFIVGHIKNACKKSRPGFYTNKMRDYVKDIERGGLRALPAVRTKMGVLKAGKDINSKYINTLISWIDYILMFKNVKTGSKSKASYEENYSKIKWGSEHG